MLDELEGAIGGHSRFGDDALLKVLRWTGRQYPRFVLVLQIARYGLQLVVAQFAEDDT